MSHNQPYPILAGPVANVLLKAGGAEPFDAGQRLSQWHREQG